MTVMFIFCGGNAWELHQRQAAPRFPAPLKASSHPSATGILQCERVAHGRGPGTVRAATVGNRAVHAIKLYETAGGLRYQSGLEWHVDKLRLVGGMAQPKYNVI